MSDIVSVANFYVDREGSEQPIRYEAKDLVNVLAPQGYHWELDTRNYDERLAQFSKAREDSWIRLPYPVPEYPPRYIAVRNKN